jgi:hypothetical protein
MCQKFPGGTGEENKKVSGLAATQLCRTEVHSHVGTTTLPNSSPLPLGSQVPKLLPVQLNPIKLFHAKVLGRQASQPQKKDLRLVGMDMA